MGKGGNNIKSNLTCYYYRILTATCVSVFHFKTSITISSKVLKSVKTVEKQIWDDSAASHEFLESSVWWVCVKEIKIAFHLAVMLKMCEEYMWLKSIRFFFCCATFILPTCSSSALPISFNSVEVKLCLQLFPYLTAFKRSVEPQ